MAIHDTFSSVFENFLKKVQNPELTCIVFNGPYLWAQAPSLSLATVCSDLATRGVSAYGFDLNFLLYLRFAALKSSWTKPSSEARKMVLNDLLCNEIWQPLWKALQDKPELHIGISLTSSNEDFLFESLRFLKKLLPESSFFMGGPQVYMHARNDFRSMPEDIYEMIDRFVIGEIEKTDFSLKASAKTFYPEKKEVSCTAPDFDQFELKAYPRKKHLPMMVGRGCICQCAFCSEHMLFDRYQAGNIASIIDSIKTYHNKYGVSWFTFYDSLIDGDLVFLEELCDELIALDFPVLWEAQFLVRRDLTPGLMHKIKQSGCYNLFVGMESGSNAMLKMMRKPFRIDDLRRFFKYAEEAKLHFEVSLIVGFPGETREYFDETVRFLTSEMDRIPKLAQVNPFLFYPHTSIADKYPERPLFQTYYQDDIVADRVQQILQLFAANGVPFTSNYINNLLVKTG